ncbi:hydantoinase B/oxoprolinase family protein [Bradyrhizobium sp. BWC-3-1]|uniref:hydantoinase B/oxoprolinase family protein n=1 Tax=Bradyrhizobium sp. BWC-3-1 TaxID=3080012 RepID=UPI001F0A5B38|nr:MULTISPECIES: hydantoinase B/oxoprolinase family protein [Bradyrhizobium]WOH62720.1 hydantoinase B/oxoprolinase family protein [Bradyrhizobium sp. BWC-3-1]
MKAITDHTIPINQGCYRPVEIICPEGTVLNCTYPASVVSGVTETSPRIIDMLLKTLAPAIPNRVVNDAACSGIFSGEDPDERRVKSLHRRYVQHIDPHAGGYGARPALDGINAIRVLVGNAGIQSIELIEHLVPLRVESWHLVPDSGGAGRNPGELRRLRGMVSIIPTRSSGEITLARPGVRVYPGLRKPRLMSPQLSRGSPIVWRWRLPAACSPNSSKCSPP